MSDPRSLTERLKALGYSHAKAGIHGQHAVTDDRSGEVVFKGTAYEVTDWMLDGCKK